MNNLLHQLHQYENKLGLTDDAIIHKTMQEWLEFVEAVQSQDVESIIGETGDAISNMLSSYHRVSDGQEISLWGVMQDSTALDLAINLGKRNDTIQKFRDIYSRNPASLESLTSITQDNIGQILWLAETSTGQQFDVSSLLEQQLNKFWDRLNQYSSYTNLEDYVRDIPNFPKEWILFKDISPLLKNPHALQYVVHQLSEQVKNADVIVGLDARGFIFGTAVARYLNKPFVMVRKKGKLPGEVIEESYDLEYGSNTQAIQVDSIAQWQKVAIIDDLLATGGTAASACKLIEKLWGTVQWCHFVIELKDLQGRDKLSDYDVTQLMQC